MWSRSTFVIAATPPSQAWVASSLPPSPTSTSARSTRSSANQRKTIAVRSSNSVGGPSRRGTAIGGGERLADEPGERRRVDRTPADLQPLAVGDEVRLRRLADAAAGRPERGRGQGEDAALAVRARDERPANGALRIAELAQERTRPAQPEPDAEAAAIGERLERGRVLGLDRHSRVRSSS